MCNNEKPDYEHTFIPETTFRLRDCFLKVAGTCCQHPRAVAVVKFHASPEGTANGYVELKVSQGNAAYRPGECFWLAPDRLYDRYECAG